jgi:toxin secretion/phage lysis holin
MPDTLIVPTITLLFILLDIVTGVVQAVANKELSSTKLRQGLFHKFAFMFAMILGYLVEFGMGYLDLGFTVPIATPVCIYICLTEIVSILENITLMNEDLKNSKFLSLFNVTDKAESEGLTEKTEETEENENDQAN